MKLNNKGFAVSGIIYALMFLFIILIFATLGLLGSRKVVLDKYKKSTVNNLENDYEVLSSAKIDRSGASTPVLANSMIPIVYNGSNWVKAEYINEYEQNWYDYSNKKWANAALVKLNRYNTYLSSSAGTVINSADILGYFVWIPRYKYILFNADYSNHINGSQLINVAFEDKNVYKATGVSNGEYLTHKAFNFGGKQLSGFWFGKFETTGSLTGITVLPNTTPIIDKTVKEMFDSVKNSGALYGIGNSDFHMTKSSEWAAVAYLTNSIYGIGNTEVRKNAFNQNGFRTGCGSNTTSNAPRTAGCEMGFGSSSTYPQSTTGNIYGVFDMSGGAWEYVMGVINSSGGVPLYSNSGFTTSTMPEGKYYDVFASGTSSSDISRATIGTATKETWGWFDDRTTLVVDDAPWQFRGGCRNDQNDVGIYSMSAETGAGNGSISFRTTLVTD